MAVPELLPLVVSEGSALLASTTENAAKSTHNPKPPFLPAMSQLKRSYLSLSRPPFQPRHGRCGHFPTTSNSCPGHGQQSPCCLLNVWAPSPLWWSLSSPGLLLPQIFLGLMHHQSGCNLPLLWFQYGTQFPQFIQNLQIAWLLSGLLNSGVGLHSCGATTVLHSSCPSVVYSSAGPYFPLPEVYHHLLRPALFCLVLLQ